MSKNVPLSSALPGAAIAALLAFSPLVLTGAAVPTARTTPMPSTSYPAAAGTQQVGGRTPGQGSTATPTPEPTNRGGELDPAQVVEAEPVIVKIKDRLAWPNDARTLTSAYGPRIDPVNGVPSFHTGSDLAEPCGTPIRASADGVVKFQGAAGDYGYRVVLQHEQVDGKDLLTSYSHLATIAVKEGDTVKTGDVIATEGTTGWSTGCHLHFEVILDGWFTDPWTWLTGEETGQPSVKVGSLFPVGPIPDMTPTPTPSTTPTESEEPSPSGSPEEPSPSGTPEDGTPSPSPDDPSPSGTPEDPSPSPSDTPGDPTPSDTPADPTPSDSPTATLPSPSGTPDDERCKPLDPEDPSSLPEGCPTPTPQP